MEALLSVACFGHIACVALCPEPLAVDCGMGPSGIVNMGAGEGSFRAHKESH